MNTWKQRAIFALIMAFAIWNPFTRRALIFLLPTGRAVDDLIMASLIALAVVMYFTGAIKAITNRHGGKMTRYLRRFIPIVGLMLVLTSTTGCYFNYVVNPNEVAVRLSSGKISEITGAGMYSGGLFSSITTIDTSSKTIAWQDPDLVTKDKQPIGLSLGITYVRMRDTESVRMMFERYRFEATDDAVLANLVNNRVPRIAKAVTAQFTLNEMLGIEGRTQSETPSGREVVSRMIFEALKPELAEFGVELLDVGVNNIAPDAQYLDALKAKAAAQIGVEVAQQETLKLVEQLAQEEAQTEISIEKARRENLVNAELAKTYETSPQYFELERLKLLGGIYGPRDKIIIVPQGSDPNIFLGSGVVPVPGQ